MWNWFEDDTLWEKLEGFLFSQFRSSAITGREAEQILGLVHLPQGAAVLDLCCGPGRHALEFARRGFRVTGVDRTARYLATARAAETREGLTVEFVQEDMRHFHRPAAFDLALNLFAQFLAVCSRLKWSKHVTKSPCLALLAMAGSSAAYNIISACSNAVS